MGQNGFFRRAMLGGFNQGDVLEYIDEQQKQLDVLRTENAKFYEEYKALHDKYEKDKREVAEAFEKLKAISVAYKEKAAENSYLSREVEVLKGKIVKLQEMGVVPYEDAGIPDEELNADGEKQTGKTRAKIDSNEIGKAFKAAYENDSEMPENVSKEIGALLIEAKHTADNLLKKAHEEVDGIKAEGIEHAKQNIGLIENTNSQLQLLKSRMEDVFSRFADNLDTMCRELDLVKESVKEQENSLQKPKPPHEELADILDESQAAFTILQSEIQDVINNLDMSGLSQTGDSDIFGISDVSDDMQREISAVADLLEEKGKRG